MELRNPVRVISQRYVDTQGRDSTDHWSEGANCRTADPDLMYGKSWRTALRVCAECPIQRECRVVGMGEAYGTWGGLTEQDRRMIRANVPDWQGVDRDDDAYSSLPITLDNLVTNADSMGDVIESLPVETHNQPLFFDMSVTRWDHNAPRTDEKGTLSELHEVKV